MEKKEKGKKKVKIYFVGLLSSFRAVRRLRSLCFLEAQQRLLDMRESQKYGLMHRTHTGPFCSLSITSWSKLAKARPGRATTFFIRS